MLVSRGDAPRVARRLPLAIILRAFGAMRSESKLRAFGAVRSESTLRAFGAAGTKFTWGKAMSGRNFTSAALTILLILVACPALIAQKKKTPPAATPPAPASTAPTGELIGKRITFTDGGTLDVDDTWKQGDTIWYRLHGTSQSLSRPIRTIENRYKEAPAANKATTKTVAPKPAPVVKTWIYLVDGARLRVDEVREVADGAWYNRDKVTVFLAKERIGRIERVSDALTTPGEDWKTHGWSSGDVAIDNLIRTNASRFAIDPYLVFLVIEQESHFHPRAVSPKGARGLMQLMPGTARRFGVLRPFDPADNIRGGTQYLKQLLTMFNGQVDLALASYNAGEGRVLDYGNRVPPFKETRDYVKRISSRYRKLPVQSESEPVAKTPNGRQ